jgi:hypothetical protein
MAKKRKTYMGHTLDPGTRRATGGFNLLAGRSQGPNPTGDRIYEKYFDQAVAHMFWQDNLPGGKEWRPTAKKKKKRGTLA